MCLGIFVSKFPIDLNWHTLTSTANDYGVLLSRNWTATAKKDFFNSWHKWWKMMKIRCVKYRLSNSSSGKYNDVTIWDWVIVEWCVGVFWDNNTLNIDWFIAWWNDFALATNGSQTKNATININRMSSFNFW